MKTNTWYILAKKDNRTKYGYRMLMKPNKMVFENLDVAKQTKEELNDVVILKRTCKALEV